MARRPGPRWGHAAPRKQAREGGVAPQDAASGVSGAGGGASMGCPSPVLRKKMMLNAPVG